MGLGKTVQTIAFLSAILGKTGDARTDQREARSRGDIPRAAIRAAALRSREVLTEQDADGAERSGRVRALEEPRMGTACLLDAVRVRLPPVLTEGEALAAAAAQTAAAVVRGDDSKAAAAAAIACAPAGNNKTNTPVYNQPIRRWPILLVVPATLVPNWLDELELWGEFSVALYLSASGKDAARGGGGGGGGGASASSSRRALAGSNANQNQNNPYTADRLASSLENILKGRREILLTTPSMFTRHVEDLAVSEG
jgi:hypothetical protein